MQNRPTPEQVVIRGEMYAIQFPSDFRIKQIGEFIDSGISNRSRERELASSIALMIPGLPVELASCQEFSQDDGSTSLSHQFSLQSHELLDIVKSATVGYVKILLHDLRQEQADRPSADTLNLIAQFERELAEAEAELAKSSLMQLSKAAGLALTQKHSAKPPRANPKKDRGFAQRKPDPALDPEPPFETEAEELARLRQLVGEKTPERAS